MVFVDYMVLLIYALGLLGVGLFYATRVRDASDMFAAGGRSPWWMSGLSAFMTMFSAGTFVVWGGIAYRYGMVAVCISLCYGVAALLVGWTLAAYWRRLGVSSAAEFLDLRFGRSIVQFYTWLQGFIGTFALGLTVYGLSVITAALVPIPQGHLLAFLADDATGHLSVPLLSAAICVFVVLITFGGGLWAVLITDTLQFIVLAVSVVFVVPLIFAEVGGAAAFVRQAGQTVVDDQGHTLLSPVAGDFTWWFLVGWIAVHYFKVGGEWAFVQRFTCVPGPADARKSAMLFGVMYLVSPLFWMLPPMVYRLIQPIPDGLPPELLTVIPEVQLAGVPQAVLASLQAGVTDGVDPALIAALRETAINEQAQQAYIRACELVLPAGMIGLMVAAMASATASMATTQLNVYAGAFTTEIYQKLLRPGASQRELVRAGRAMTVLLGGVVLAGAVLIPTYATYTGYIIAVTAMLTGPLLLPTIWGLFSRKLGLTAVWTVTLFGGSAAILARFGFGANGWFTGIAWLSGVAEVVQANARVTDLVVGSAATLLGLAFCEALSREEKPGWQAVARAKQAFHEAPPAPASVLPAKICGWTVALLAAVMAALAAFDAQDRGVLLLFAALLGAIASAILMISYRAAARAPLVVNHASV